jgi:CheY-like chemotaxis protein
MTTDSFSPGPPAPIDPAPARPAESGTSAALPGVSRPTARILVVEDEPINVRIIQLFLSRAGYSQVSAIDSGEAALKLLAAGLPDLILLDIFFVGGINGIEMLERLRTLPGGRELPVLILTASEDPAIKRRALELGAIGFIYKPVSSADLLAWVARALSARQSSGAGE